MKQKTLLYVVLGTFFVLSMAACTAVLHHHQPTHTCTQVSIIRANGAEGILWLPVQESQGDARIRIIADNQPLEQIHVRLAKDSIDYFVPYELSRWGNRDLVIEFRTWLPDTARREQMVCWQAITTGDADLYPMPANPFRCEYHHTPFRGWMNDPNGMYYDEATGLWHLYYQYNPYGARWHNMHWAHSTSRDLIHWEHQPVAIRPTLGWGTIFSGSCVIDRNNTAGFGENAVVALYTADGESQKQAVAYSLDGGMTFTHYAGNPVLCDTIADFRDPKVFWDELSNRWVMALACQQEIRFYASDNLRDWTYLSRFGEGVGCHDGVWECPDLVKLSCENGEMHWVLLVNINPGGPFGGSATQYFVGDWDGKKFSSKANANAKWLDYGKDHYATVTWHNAPDNRVVAIGWMSNWEYANELPTRQFRSQNTIARDLSLYTDDKGEYRVAVVPSPENNALRGAEVAQPTAACVIDVDFEPSELTHILSIRLSNDQGEKVLMLYDMQHKTFSMDRRHAGDHSFSKHFAAVTTTPLFRVPTQRHQLHIFVDRCSIEAFDGEGAWAMTNLVFPSEPYNHIEVQGGKATIYECK